MAVAWERSLEIGSLFQGGYEFLAPSWFWTHRLDLRGPQPSSRQEGAIPSATGVAIAPIPFLLHTFGNSRRGTLNLSQSKLFFQLGASPA
jgi:hypothetical protein